MQDEIFIQNTAPTVTEVTITPDENVLADSILTCDAQTEDFDGDEDFVTYSWSNSQGSIPGTSNIDSFKFQSTSRRSDYVPLQQRIHIMMNTV